ncbi:hypothetical protein TRFO_31319 [Tritrichomonas foetus]|uniref:EF-hand domain-containing protein n=1 Tax=Tritrichomonas foetus TaxID=1144522 RepID=A0A1J4JRU5_9EUKA|nr:hypothetical protein TRFO_31319 [Tritrichomonas foetus]|eukprot:OHT01755.1 hypothetical protein TRFO_31319 [Tritrichomonas foetus]
MAEAERLNKILQDVLDRVKHRGSSSKVNWMNFSNGQPVSRAKFDSIIEKYGFPLRDGDLDLIWGNIEVKGKTMGYSDYIRFITMDKIDASKASVGPRPLTQQAPSYAEKTSTNNTYRDAGNACPRPTTNPTYSSNKNQNDYGSNQSSGTSISKILIDYKASIGKSMISIDPNFTGLISVHEFEDILQRIALVNSSDVKRLVGIYDKSNCGYFNYFMLLGDICNQSNDLPPTMSGGSGRVGSGGRSSGSTGYNDASFADDYSQRNSGMSIGYSNYSAPPADEYSAPSQSAPAGTSRINEIITTIASRMDTVYDSTQSCFQKWRGSSRALGPQEFVAGIQRDFKYNVSLDEATSVISRFSNKGILSLGDFMKMVGEGSDSIQVNYKQKCLADLTDEEKTLMHIARQGKAKGGDWQDVLERCDSCELAVQSLRSLNIYVMLNDLRPCYKKFGKNGVIQKVHEFMSQV